MASPEGDLTAATRDLITAFRNAEQQAKKSAEAIAKETRDRRTSALATLGGSAAGVAAGALNSIGAGGGNITANNIGAGVLQGIRDALPAIGGALGTLLGPGVGTLAGVAAGTAGQKAFDATVGQNLEARQAAIAEVAALSGPRAAAGLPLDPETLGKLLAVAFERQLAVVGNRRAITDIAPVFTSGAGR